jgi:hypothetical protein
MISFSRNPQTKYWRSLSILVVALYAVGVSMAPAEEMVTLAWSPSYSSDIAGYYVYSYEENSTVPSRVDVGPLTQATLPGLKEGLRYTFTVTAYNAVGLESVPSNEVPFVVPVPLRLLVPASPTSFKKLQFPAAPGHWYELQMSTNLQSWTTIWQTGVANAYSWVEYQDPQSSSFKPRFYRLKVN